MKKLLVRGSIALMSLMLVLSFAACPEPDGSADKSDAAFLNTFLALKDDLAISGELGIAVSAPEWDELDGKDDLGWDSVGDLDFSGEPSAAVTFQVSASKNAAVTYAVVKGSALPVAGDFNELNIETLPLATNDSVYFKVVSESEKVTNYYYVVVTGMGDAPSSSIVVSGVKVGGGEAVNPIPSSGSQIISSIIPISYSLPSADMTGSVTLQLNRGHADQTISWVKTDADAAVPADSDFIVFAPPESGNTLSAAVSSAGLADGDKIYLKVLAADRINVIYYGFAISAGNIARLASLSLAGMEVTTLGEPGTAWNNTTAGAFDYQDEPPVLFFLAAAAEDGGKVAYAITSNNTDVPSFIELTGTPGLTLTSGSILYIKVTSVNEKATVFYKINILMKSSAILLYGQPEISKGANGGAPTIDPLWETQNWMFDVSRVNLNEMNPAYRFLNTVDGNYDNTGYGHTEGRAKAFWDDYGMYVYAEMTFHDYYENAAASAIVRTTVVTPPLAQVSDSNAHLYDSLELFTNERVQQFTQGGYGIQYRVAPSPEGQTVAGTNSRISGYPPDATPGAGANAITTFRNSGNYYSWIRTEAGKEVGYSVIAYIPWMFKTDNNASDVFDNNGNVKTVGNDVGPSIGAEFQLNTVTTGGSRDAILTWNGVTGQSYNQVKNYGKVTMITGDLSARGITRGAKDPAPVQVSFDTDGGTPATIDSISVITGQPADAAFPPDPTKAGFNFDGWYDESVTPNVKYDSATAIIKALTLKARWVEAGNEGNIVFSLTDWITANPGVTALTQSVASHRPLQVNGTVPTSNYGNIVGDALKLFVGSSGQGLQIHINAGNLDLKPAERIYEVRIEGSIAELNASTSSGPQIRITTTASNDALANAALQREVGFTFSITYRLPENLDANLKLTASSVAAGMTFLITKIEIEDMGPR